MPFGLVPAHYKQLVRAACGVYQISMGLLDGIRKFAQANANEQTADQLLKECFWYYQWATEDAGINSMPIARVTRAWELYLKDQHPKQLVIFGTQKESYLFDAVAQFACLPDPECGHALSLFIFSQKHAPLVARFPKYEAYFADSLGELASEIQNQDWSAMNHRFEKCNPDFSIKNPFPVGSWKRMRDRGL